MQKPDIQTARRVIPIIYCYTTPEIARHSGWVKIGYSEQDADTRIGQQTHTADVEYHIEWQKNAVFDDGSGDVFRDSDFHVYLTKNGIERLPHTEWFHISPGKAKDMLDDFRENRGASVAGSTVIPYTLRDEQQRAVDMAKDYFRLHESGEFLFNAKPRFGKTLTVYDLCRTMGLKNILIVTNRPAIANSWYEDYSRFFGQESGYFFVSGVDALKDKPGVLTRDEYADYTKTREVKGVIVFLSLQDLKGSEYFGGNYDKLQYVRDMHWDILVIDEAHEGVDTIKTDVAFDRITRKYTLHLSGTPFKALADEKFPENAIFNWTYADEQEAKHSWNKPERNPYANLPQLNMYTYQLSEMARDKAQKGIEIDGEKNEFYFDLNEFFATDERGYFLHNEEINRFLDALTTQEKFPFSTPELRGELKHTLWLLNRVDSAKALARKLKKHSVFKEYYVVIAAGDGRLDEDDDGTASKKSYDKVKDAIAKYDKTITLSVGQLTTGVTIPEWTAVLMLSSIQSPALYMQAAFRAQNPCLFHEGTEHRRKQNAYIFDFDPARTLDLYEQFANRLSPRTANGHGDIADREENIRKLLNFFPVIGEDENGEMLQLDAAKVLSIPRKIKSREVVRHGFMSDYLFQNISAIFRAPQEVLDTIKDLTPSKDPGALGQVTRQTADDLDLDENGEVELPDSLVIGTAAEVFGEPVREKARTAMEEAVSFIADSAANFQEKKDGQEDEAFDRLKQQFHDQVTNKILDIAGVKFGDDMTAQTRKKLESKINADADTELGRTFGRFQINRKTIEEDRRKELDKAESREEADKVNAAFDKKIEDVTGEFKENVAHAIDDVTKRAGNTVVRDLETAKKEKAKRTIEDSVRDHLRGFSRTIPSFLMAYGDENTTLENFDRNIDDTVFQEVTSITLEQFRFLRDGGDYVDDETGKTEHFEGHLFDPIVFNDSVKEFLNLKQKLADYFDEKNEEDIFDYIPPQKTNQIFTPRNIVVEMTDKLEEENPGCFDDPDKTFADLYMKSGMYITEIVKRLYRSPHLEALYPDSTERLNHIFAKQVYGLAPTKIIYQICLNYILGFSDKIRIDKHNIRLCDALEYAQKGTLEQKLEEMFPELKKN